MNVSLHLVYEGRSGRPMTAASVSDRELMVHVARKAIGEAFDHAQAMSEVDVFVGAIKKEEAERLQKVLRIMLPELDDNAERVLGA